MNRTGRPVSPHVTVYAFPIAALSSITNRVTGCAMSGICAGVGLMEIFGGSGTSLSVMQSVGGMGLPIAPLAKFGMSFTFVYHYFAGLRHLVWDANPEKLTNEQVEQASLYLYGGSAAASAVLMLL
jgi:succinate dehydrogenase (ubiquinone) cytochrome b560 subunit